VWQLRDGRQTYLGETKEKINRLGLMNSAAELLPTGTVVFSRTASVGFSGIMPIPMATTQDFWNWIPGKKLISEFLVYVFRAMRQEFDRLTMGSTHKTIYQPDAAGISICVPPIVEQNAIVDFLDAHTAKLDTLIAKKQELIEKLKEKRSTHLAHGDARPPARSRPRRGAKPEPQAQTLRHRMAWQYSGALGNLQVLTRDTSCGGPSRPGG
jgi:type I restriction enzyme S subunit